MKPSHLRALHVQFTLEIGDEGFRNSTRIGAGLLRFPRIDHRGIGREVAMVASRGGSTTKRPRSRPRGSCPAAIRFSSRLAMRDWKSAKIFMDPDMSAAPAYVAALVERGNAVQRCRKGRPSIDGLWTASTKRARASIESRKHRQKAGRPPRSRTGPSCRRCNRRQRARALVRRPWPPIRAAWRTDR